MRIFRSRAKVTITETDKVRDSVLADAALRKKELDTQFAHLFDLMEDTLHQLSDKGTGELVENVENECAIIEDEDT